MSAAAVLAALSSAAWLYGNASHECVLLRAEFTLSEEVGEAIVGFAAAGYGEVWLNGKKAEEKAVLEPGWTQWNKRLLVPTYDVKNLVRQGTNAIGLALGAGWYGHLKGPPAIKAALLVTDGKGQSTSIFTNATWTGGKCPIIYNDIYNGETYDARLEEKDWASPGGGQGWRPANASSNPPVNTTDAVLQLQEMPPISKLEVLPVFEAVVVRANGSALLDFGVNIAGWVQLTLDSCKSGTVVTIRTAEILTDDRGSLNTKNLRKAKATDTYICSGGPVFYEPRFVYHGFRYADIDVNGTASWSWAKQKARIVHSAVQQRGQLMMENTILTKIHAAVRRTLLDNLHSVPTDCPQRDERQGWMADAALAAEQAAYNFDMKSFYTNWLSVMVDAQESGDDFGDCRMPGGTNASIQCKGAMTDTSPHVPGLNGNRPADPSWGVALPITAEVLQRHYGAEVVAKDFVHAIHGWADFLLSVRGTDGVVRYHYYGDWLQPGRDGSSKVVSEMTSGFSTILAVEYASQVGTPEQQQHYAQELPKMRQSYINAFWNNKSQSFGDDTQAAQVFALTLGGVPQEQDDAAWKRLLNLLSTQGIRTGIVSTRYLFPLLSKYGRTDIGLRLASNTAYPSWGYEMENGGTTIWEHFERWRTRGTMNSFNHPCWTSVGSWFYTDLVGIRVQSGGWLELGPTLDEHNDLLPSAQGSLTVEEGLAEIKWAMKTNEVSLEGSCPKARCGVRVPLNGMDFSTASAALKQQGFTAIPCRFGLAACGNVTTGAFALTLAPKLIDVFVS